MFIIDLKRLGETRLLQDTIRGVSGLDGAVYRKVLPGVRRRPNLVISLTHAYEVAPRVTQDLFQCRSEVRRHQAKAVARRTERNVKLIGRDTSRLFNVASSGTIS